MELYVFGVFFDIETVLFRQLSTKNLILRALLSKRPTNLLGPILPKADTQDYYLETLVLIEFPASLMLSSKATLSLCLDTL